MSSTNHIIPLRLEEYSRRWMLFECNKEQSQRSTKRDHSYFKTYYARMTDDVRAAVAGFFLQMDVSSFEQQLGVLPVNDQIPMTPLLQINYVVHFSSEKYFWYHVLKQRCNVDQRLINELPVMVRDYVLKLNAGCEYWFQYVPLNLLYKYYTHIYNRYFKVRRFAPISDENLFWTQSSNVIPIEKALFNTGHHVVRIGDFDLILAKFPAYSECLQFFEQLTGVDVNTVFQFENEHKSSIDSDLHTDHASLDRGYKPLRFKSYTEMHYRKKRKRSSSSDRDMKRARYNSTSRDNSEYEEMPSEVSSEPSYSDIE